MFCSCGGIDGKRAGRGGGSTTRARGVEERRGRARGAAGEERESGGLISRSSESMSAGAYLGIEDGSGGGGHSAGEAAENSGELVERKLT